VALDNAFVAQHQRRQSELAEEVLHDVRNLVQPFRDLADGVEGLALRDLQGPAAAVAQIAQRYGDAASLERTCRTIDVPRVLGVWQRAYLHLAAERQVRLQLALDPHEGPLEVVGDPTELQRAVGNLLSNGIKYAQRGGEVVIRVGVRALGAPPDDVHPRMSLVIDVLDDGPGVPRGYEERVFERDVQAVGARKGLGLGLTIARRVAREHGGDVTLLPSSRGGHFRMTLPLRDADDGAEGRGAP
jgi:signal transduction histidine kinase